MGHQYSKGFERVGRFITRYAAAVLLTWIAVAVVVSTAWPTLEDVASRKASSPLPKESSSISAMTAMAEKFDEDGNLNSAIIVMSNPDGMTADARSRYNATVERLRERRDAVTFVSDVLGDPVASSNPMVRGQVMSEDGKAWILLVGLVGELGSPTTLGSLTVVRDVVEQTYAGADTVAKVTGPTATLGDLAVTSVADIRIVGAITMGLIALILLAVYRSVFTAVLPLVVLGVSITVARGVVAGLSEIGLPISTMSSTLMVAILAGASVNYTVFMISRYHENLRSGLEPQEALPRASGSMSRVIVATAATIAVANLAQLTAKLEFLSAAGPAVAVAITIGFLASVTLLPAVLSLAARVGLGLAREDRTGEYWRRTGRQVAARPMIALTASVAVLALLAGAALFLQVGYDDREVQPQNTESAEGYALMNAHFPRDAMIPQYVLVESEEGLRHPQALADLEQMAQRISQLPGVDRVIGITRPDGKKLTQATLSWQIAMMGKQLAKADEKSPQVRERLDQIQALADTLRDLTSDGDGLDLATIGDDAAEMLQMAKGAAAQMEQYAGLITEISKATGVIDELAAVSPVLVAASDALGGAGSTLVPALDSPACKGNRECRRVRTELAPVLNLARGGQLDQLADLARSLSTAQGRSAAKETIGSIGKQYDQIRGALAQVPEWEARLGQLQKAMDQMRAAGIDLSDPKTMAGRARTMADQAREAMSAMTALAAYLQTVGTESSSESASGFYLPTALLDSSDFGRLTSAFVSPDGKAVRFLVQSSVNPYSSEAMALSSSIGEVGRDALPNTSLAASKVSVGGFPAVNNDLQEMFLRDFAEIVIVTLLVILVVMCLLLRAVVAPIYLLGTVILTYGSAIGLGVLVFQGILGQEIYWAVPAMAFTMVIAVGADYNMFFVSRLREESGTGSPRDAIEPTVAATGSVITSAGLIFSAAMFGMMGASIATVAQMGFIIGAGILIDTFIVRTITVPAIAALVGRRSWWPSAS